MAALIDISNDRSNIAYVGETPWHGLGQKLTVGAPLEVWAKEAGMEWEAKKTRSMFADENGVIHQGEENILYRSDTKVQLGSCSDRYQIVQPMEVIEFYRDLVATHGWNIETAGCLDGGKRLWALAKTDGEISVNGTIDKIGTYLLLATSFDGTMATTGKFTSVRVVCQNTLSMSVSGKGAKICVPHSTTFDANSMKEELGIYAKATEEMQDVVNELAKRKMKNSEAMKFILSVLDGKEDDIEKMSTRGRNIAEKVYGLFTGAGKGATLATADGTLWGALNAVTEYVDHHINTRTDNNRMKSAWFGKGDEMKTVAYNAALKMVA